MSLEERERSLLEREELGWLKEELERREEELSKRARAVSPLNDHEKRQELFDLMFVYFYFRTQLHGF